MCGRMALISSSDDLAAYFDLGSTPDLKPRYNIAPGQETAFVRSSRAGTNREWAILKWGLIPPWAKSPGVGARMINARSETAAEKPAFRRAMAERRGLAPADGFYEWSHGRGKGWPYFFRRRDGLLMALAGLWERWESTAGTIVESFTVLTTSANEQVRPIHDRMPVIVAPKDFDRWLDPGRRDPRLISDLLEPAPADELTAYRVGDRVNDPRHDDPGCLEAASDSQLFLWPPD